MSSTSSSMSGSLRDGRLTPAYYFQPTSGVCSGNGSYDEMCFHFSYIALQLGQA